MSQNLHHFVTSVRCQSTLARPRSHLYPGAARVRRPSRGSSFPRSTGNGKEPSCHSAGHRSRESWKERGEDIEKIVIDWLWELRDLGAQDDNPLFPRGFKKHWGELKEARFDFLASATHVRHMMKAAAETAGTQFFRPHAIRSTIARMIERWGATAEERKALSQNLGHQDYRTTLVYYGTLDEDHQHALVESIRNRGEVDPHLDILQPFSKAPDNIRKAMFTLLAPYR